MSGVPAVAWRDVTFAYRGAPAPVLSHVRLEVPEGSFCVVTGPTGSGKSTLLSLARPSMAPAGELLGRVGLFGEDVAAIGNREAASLVGFIGQEPAAQVVCDTPAAELAFVLENLGWDPQAMGRRLAATGLFFAMDPWLHTSIDRLSGGQVQLTALAASVVARPRLLLLDEPLSQLDPVAAQTLLEALFRLNRRAGVTVVMTSHRAEAVAPYASMAVCLGGGVATVVDPATLRRDRSLGPRPSGDPGDGALVADGVWAGYSSRGPWVLRGLDLAVPAGTVRALVGGNGSGKSTLLKVLAGVVRPRRGRVRDAGAQRRVYLPQDPREVLGGGTVAEELSAWEAVDGLGTDLATRLGLGCPPSVPCADLSCGQRQLAALAKLLACRPGTVLLDEPVKGLDDGACRAVASVLAETAEDGACVVLATHDLAFARDACSEVSMVFDGRVASTGPAATFFDDDALLGP